MTDKIWEGVPPAVTSYWESHPGTIWLYEGNFPLAIVATVIYSIPMLYLFYLTTFKYKSAYFIVVTIGAGLEVTGYSNRAVSIKKYDKIVSLLFCCRSLFFLSFGFECSG